MTSALGHPMRVARRLSPEPVKRLVRPVLGFVRMVAARVRLTVGVRPLSEGWMRRGQPIHRAYLEQFLQEFSGRIRGHCLEFQEDSYTSRFGGSKVTKRDILHREAGNVRATIVADLTAPNHIPSDTFDCVICTYVLHVVPEPSKMIAELHRVLKPNGTLFAAVPHIMTCFPGYRELWRFTAAGLQLLLSKEFGPENVTVRVYGNSLIAAGELRGLVACEFRPGELSYTDPRYAMVVCAQAVKAGADDR